MKRLIWLLAMYVLVLTGLPCPDHACHARAARAAGTPERRPPVSHDDDAHEAPCSPFCHCATCAGFTLPQPLANALPPQPSFLFIRRLVFVYQPIAPEDVAHSFWQPPKR